MDIINGCPKSVFRGDPAPLAAAREKINADFRENRDVADPAKVDELVALAADVDKVFRFVQLQLLSRFTMLLQGEIVRL